MRLEEIVEKMEHILKTLPSSIEDVDLNKIYD